MTQLELDLHNLMMYPNTKFESNVCNRSRDNERKPMMMEGQNDGQWVTLPYMPPAILWHRHKKTQQTKMSLITDIELSIKVAICIN
jgi:hypothetical protein